ncbi:MAG: D-glycero-beta-D-manno-heptose 1-phosphate adenylyltransferase [Elusimicrobiaceae bacterium]|nr:D-glycero-beta-D-manno-heptose 1-phosphate adenylyltransferase [Elusimicrobiaceae bacterium]
MNTKNKILTKEKLKNFLKKAKKEGKKVVFTNGCFDILHAGHVRIIEFSKSQGDLLILGLNTDASIKRLKGPSRPINKEKDRAIVVSALQAVDGVVLFKEDTPLNLIKIIKPDILVKGADYTKENVVGREYAGKVVLCPLVKGKSTTNIIKKAKI